MRWWGWSWIVSECSRDALPLSFTLITGTVKAEGGESGAADHGD